MIDVSRLDKKLDAIIRTIVEENGCEYVGASVRRMKSASTLAVYMDKDGGVSSSDCEAVSRRLSDELDEREESGETFFKDKYFIEVGSPGVERPLFTAEHYARFVGRDAGILLKDRRKITGKIASAGDRIVISTESGDVEVAFDDIESGRLVFTMERGEKKGGQKRPKKTRG